MSQMLTSCHWSFTPAFLGIGPSTFIVMNSSTETTVKSPSRSTNPLRHGKNESNFGILWCRLPGGMMVAGFKSMPAGRCSCRINLYLEVFMMVYVLHTCYPIGGYNIPDEQFPTNRYRPKFSWEP